MYTSPGARLAILEDDFDLHEAPFVGIVMAQELNDGVKTMKSTFTRTVSATGVFGNLVPARKFVLDLKPNLPDLISENIKEISFDGKVTGTWTFETTNTDPKNAELKGLKLWKERVNRSPGQPTHRFYYTASEDFTIKSSVLFRGGNQWEPVHSATRGTAAM